MKQLINYTKYIGAAYIIICLCTNCHNYYLPLRVTPPAGKEAMHALDSLKLQNRYFVLRNGSDAYYMRYLQLNAGEGTLTCTLDTLSSSHQLHLVSGINHKLRYKKTDPQSLGVLNEVHLYIQDPAVRLGGYSLMLNKVHKIEVIEKDQKRTTNSYVLGALGYTLGTAALVTAIILATKSSCPFVSAYDGKQFTLQGEIYGGAIYPQLARHDYLPLKMAPDNNGQLQVKISNELQERQYTDLANLLVVTHDRRTRILATETGQLYSIGKTENPHTAWVNNKQVSLSPLLQHNDHSLQFMDDTSHTNGHNELLLQFHKPAGAASAKLVLSVKNSYWLDYLYGELAKGFGRFYPMYIKQQNKRSPADLLRWVKEQRIPLEVSIKTTSGWKVVTGLTTIGPVATRELVVALQDLPTEKELQVKLSGGFMFWEIDHVAIDYTPDDPFIVNECAPASAQDELNRNVLPKLKKEDGVYCEQPVPGNIATLTYNYKPVQDSALTQTFILHTKGYYTHVRHFKGGINKPFLQQFKAPDAFTTFSRQRYLQLNHSQLTAFSQN